jgi:NADH:ubiquinone reductase (H+-translocating)
MENVRRLIVVGGGIAGVDIATHLAGRNTARGRLAVTLIDQEGSVSDHVMVME